jgi:hypothetical protein
MEDPCGVVGCSAPDISRELLQVRQEAASIVTPSLGLHRKAQPLGDEFPPCQGNAGSSLDQSLLITLAPSQDCIGAIQQVLCHCYAVAARVVCGHLLAVLCPFQVVLDACRKVFAVYRPLDPSGILCQAPLDPRAEVCLVKRKVESSVPPRSNFSPYLLHGVCC